MATTHPAGPRWQANVAQWRDEIRNFSTSTVFSGLRITLDEPGESESFVTFHATLGGSAGDLSFGERSRFFKVGSRWFYHSGRRL